MGYFLIAAIVVLLIIATFMLMIFLPKPQCFYTPLDMCKELLLFNKDDHAKTITAELVDVKETITLYDGSKINDDMYKWPTLDMLLRTIPDLQTAQLTVIPAKFSEDKHHDSRCSMLRCLFPIEGVTSKKAGIWCDGERKLFKPYEWLIYDPSKYHHFFNEAKKDACKILTLDVLFQDASGLLALSNVEC